MQINNLEKLGPSSYLTYIFNLYPSHNPYFNSRTTVGCHGKRSHHYYNGGSHGQTGKNNIPTVVVVKPDPRYDKY